jgi:signal-transduction protein with cAMP-binding, CBS, and nucleotidyltransferase domain
VIKDLSALTVSENATLLQTIEAINAGAKQIALVVDESQKLLGTVTDGDVRRGLLRGLALDASVLEVMNKQPHVASPDEDPQEVMAREFSKSIHQLQSSTSTASSLACSPTKTCWSLPKFLRQWF